MFNDKKRRRGHLMLVLPMTRAACIFSIMSDEANKQWAPTPPIATSGMKVARSSNQTSFREGHAPPPGSGRPKGSRNRPEPSNPDRRC
jgi:hypothetical protein